MGIHVGYAKKDITPSAGIELCGFGYYLQRKAENTSEKLWCRAARLKHGSDSAIFVVCDLIGLSVAFTDSLRQEIAGHLNVSSATIFIACTHTHYGPATMLMEGLGVMDENYMAFLKGAIIQCVLEVDADIQPAVLQYGEQEVPEISYNRQNNSYEPLDTQLKALLCVREQDTICLALFSCHPVCFGADLHATSTDWPGAFAARLEAKNIKPLIFQGCCGDVDPIIRRQNDNNPHFAVITYAALLEDALLSIQRHARTLPSHTIKATEIRVNLPLALEDMLRIEDNKHAWIKFYKNKEAGFDNIPNAYLFIEHWAQRAKAMLPVLEAQPYLDNVPLQCIIIDSLKILGIPGEVFTNFGLQFQHDNDSLMVIGFCGGNVGYLPTRISYEIPYDYACYAAPKFYHCFPFQPSVESVLETGAAYLLMDDTNLINKHNQGYLQ